MKYEPPIDHHKLLLFLQQSYGIPARHLLFVPMGMVSCSYIVEGDGQRWFLKLLGPSRLAQIARERLGFYLPVCERLFELGHAVPNAIRTRSGQWVGDFEDQHTVLAPYLEGQVVVDLPHPTGLYPRLGAAVAHLHRDTPLLGLDPAACPYVERWQPHWRPTLLAGMARAASLDPTACRPGQARLRDLLLREQEQIRSMLARMDDLGRAVQASQPLMVLVNTDLNYSNLILGDTGRLWLLDWEGAMLGPAENDLFIFTGDDFEDFLVSYGREFGLGHLSAESFGYNFYRRNLEDVTDWVVTILHENTRDEQDAEDLEGIQSDCMGGWPWLEDGIERVRKMLKKYKAGRYARLLHHTSIVESAFLPGNWTGENVRVFSERARGFS